MGSLSDLVLVESKSAREGQIANFSHERSQDVLSRVKGLYFALWHGTGIASTEQVAEFYGVSTDVVRDNVRRFKDEFESDGLKVAKGKVLKDVREIISLTPDTPQANLWTPRATLRLGMLLRDSEVAKQVRNTLLDMVEKVVPAQVEELEKLRLQLELAKTQERLAASTQTLETIAPGLGQLVLGRADATVERVVTVEHHAIVDTRGRIVHEHTGQSPTTVAKSLGRMAAKDLKAWLESIDRMDLLEESKTIVTCQHIPAENIPEIKKLWANRKGVRQKLIGEQN